MGKFVYIQKNMRKNEELLEKTYIHWVYKHHPFMQLFTLGFHFLQKRREEISITNKRFIYRSGLVTENIIEIPIDKIESVNVIQGMMAKMYGYGRLVVTGSGGQKIEIDMVKNPNCVRNAFLDYID